MSGFFQYTMILRWQEYTRWAKALSDSMFPVRWVEDLGFGYGYPIFNFYAPLSYYFGSIFNLIGFDALIATKNNDGFRNYFDRSIYVFFCQRIVWRYRGIVAALFYMYAPYHGVDIYVRET